MEKSDVSPLEQAFDGGFFAKVAGDVEEDEHAKKKENARVGPEIQAHLYRDSRLPKLQKSPVSVFSTNSIHAAV